MNLTTEQLTALTERVNARLAEFDIEGCAPIFEPMTPGVVRLAYEEIDEWEQEQDAEVILEYANARKAAYEKGWQDAMAAVRADAENKPPTETERKFHLDIANANGYVGINRAAQTPAEPETSPPATPPPKPAEKLTDSPAPQPPHKRHEKSTDPEPDPLPNLMPYPDVARERGEAMNGRAERVIQELERSVIVNQARRDRVRADLEAAWPAMPDLNGGIDRFAEHDVAGEPDADDDPDGDVSEPRARSSRHPRAADSAARAAQLERIKEGRKRKHGYESFEPRQNRNKLPTLDELTAELRRQAMAGVAPSQAAFDAAKPAIWATAQAHTKRFGRSWADLAKEAELKPSRSSQKA